jgi:hypothetical protein
MSLPTYGPPAPDPGCAVVDGTSGSRPCGATARWHIAWNDTPAEGLQSSLVCEQHMADVEANFVFVDRHPVGDDCLRVGARWWEGWCSAPEDAPLLGEVERPGPVEAVQRMQSAMLFMLHPDLQGHPERPGEEPTA